MLALLVGSLLVGCVDQPPQAEHCECGPEQCGLSAPVVDPALLAFLSKAKSLHHQADLAQEDGDPGRAVVLLEQLVDGPMPALSPEVREVVADTLARMAELRSGQGAFEQASADVDRGLGLATERTHYRGRLMEVRGVIEQRLHEKLLEDGDEQGAAAAKQRAIAAFQRAVDIQDEVIQRALSDAGPSQDGDPGPSKPGSPAP